MTTLVTYPSLDGYDYTSQDAYDYIWTVMTALVRYTSPDA